MDIFRFVIYKSLHCVSVFSIGLFVRENVAVFECVLMGETRVCHSVTFTSTGLILRRPSPPLATTVLP